MCGQIARTTSNTRSTDWFIDLATTQHAYKYSYLSSEYTGLRDKVVITCDLHGNFMQTPNSHLHSGAGCPKCTHIVSNKERQWLAFLKIPDDEYHRQVTLKINGSWVKVDGYDPDTQTIYEFLGDFWHGNPKKYDATAFNNVTKTTFGQLYANTLNRTNNLIKAGYKVICLWESDFNEEMIFS